MQDRTKPAADGGAERADLSTTARVLGIVRSNGNTSRAEIARITGLSRSTVTLHVDRLLEHRLLLETGLASSTGGRRPYIIQFNKAAGYIGCIDLGSTTVGLGIANLGGEVVSERTYASDVQEGPEASLSRARDDIKALLDSSGLSEDRLQALCIGFPGPVECGTGRPVAPPLMSSWDRYPIREFLARDFECPVYVDNDANLMALGEQWTGLGHGIDNFLFVNVGTGIGCGIVCQGQLYRGADGCAGDIGHGEIENQSAVCRCGNIGCLEAVAAAPALVRMATEAAVREPGSKLAEHLAVHGKLMARDISYYAVQGDRSSVEIIKLSGQLIGHVLAGLANFFNPSLIILGGGVSQAGDPWLASIRHEVYRRSLPLASRNLVIQRSRLGGRAGLVGGAILATQQLLSETGLARVTAITGVK